MIHDYIQRQEILVLSHAMYMYVFMDMPKGRALMYALKIKAPNLHNNIRGGPVDCTTKDALITLTLRELGFIRGFY